MKKFYETPELEMIKFILQDDILGASQEGSVNSQIVGDDDIIDDENNSLLDP